MLIGDHGTGGRRLAIVLFAFLGLVGAMLASAGPAAAQDDELFKTCSLYGYVVGTGGELLIESANELRALGAPNPPGIDDALDILIAFEDDTIDDPTNDEHEAAIDTLVSYFGDLCANLDVCPLVTAIGGTDADAAASAAALLRGIGAPNPPGIDQALALVAGAVDISETDIESYEAAQTQLTEYFAAACTLPKTGPGDLSRTLAIVGFSSLAVGALVIQMRRSARHLG